jgi:uncharacterized protein
MPVLNSNIITAPGTYISENTAGLIPAGLATFNRCYIIGSSPLGATNTPTQVTSFADFVNQFGTAALADPGRVTLNSVNLFFRNYQNGVLFFVRVAAATVAPTRNEYVATIGNSFDPDFHPQGYLICPEAFASLAVQGDRTAISVALENLASSEGFDWKTFTDSNFSSNTTALAQAEGLLYTTARGHLSYFFNYLKDLEGNWVPPSAAIAAIGLRRSAEQGFSQPPAGGQYPVKGVTDVQFKVTKAQQAVLNPLGINAIRYFPNKGVLVYGSRTRSSDPYYKFINTRVILNVLIGSLRSAFDNLVFSAVDGQGILFTRIRETAEAICYSLWDGGALFGASPEEAFAVICGRANNPAIDLEQGIVRCDVFVAPSPTMERLMIGITRTAIGQVQAVVTGLQQGA